MLNVTNHALRRCRERMGVPKKAVIRMVEKAFEVGKCHSDFSGSFSRYLDSIFLKERNANNMRVYNGHLFIFAGDTLITAWPVPSKYRKLTMRR